MKNILITGGAGFIGSHLVKHFVKKYPNYDIINLDALTYASDISRLDDISTYNNLKILLNSDGSLLFRNIDNSTYQYDVTFDSGSTFDVSESNNIYVNNLSTDVTLQYDSKTLSLGSSNAVRTYIIDSKLYYNYLTELT